MVILQFNKLIRNKWIWGVFAVAISAFFAFDFLFTGDNGSRGEVRPAGTIGGESVGADKILPIVNQIRSDMRRSSGNNEPKEHEINRMAWERYAALQVANGAGLATSESQMRAAIRQIPIFQANGAFDFARYQEWLRSRNQSAKEFESRVKDDITLQGLSGIVQESLFWASPMELDQMADDFSDKFTVRVARFTQTPEESAKVKVDDAKIKAWYDKNVKSLALPERVRIRYVKIDATRPEFQKKVTPSEDDLLDRYNATIDRYTVKGTNGTEVVKKFEEVRDRVRQDRTLLQQLVVDLYRTNLLNRAFAAFKGVDVVKESVAAQKVSKLEQIAKEEGVKVETSDWFALSGEVNEGFMKSPTQILPGAENFVMSVSSLDPQNEFQRYDVVCSASAVWLIEKAETSPAHTPKFEDAKKIIEPRVLREARSDAFKAKVDAIVKGGVAAVTATKDISTNLTFTAMDMGRLSIPDSGVVIRTALKLRKGEISEFTSLGGTRALVVICINRVPGDAMDRLMRREQGLYQFQMMNQGLADGWMSWNLKRKGFTPEPGFSITDETSEEGVE